MDLLTEKMNISEFFKEALTLPYQFPQLFTGKRKPSNAILLYGVSSITI